MDINRFRVQIKNRIDQLDRLIVNKEASCHNAPEGRITINPKSDGVRYYLNNNGTRTYISNKEQKLIDSLIQKDYDNGVIALAQEEKAFLEKTLSKYPRVSVEEYYSTLAENRRERISPIRISDEEFIRRWYEKPTEKKTFAKDMPEIYTNRGERVRSKSEKIIADRLAELGVPYKYEAQLVFADGERIHPDFTILDMNRRCEIYYEHCGMVDDPQYAKDMVRRIMKYSANSILIGDRLLLTFETSEIPLDSRALDQIFRGFAVK